MDIYFSFHSIHIKFIIYFVTFFPNDLIFVAFYFYLRSSQKGVDLRANLIRVSKHSRYGVLLETISTDSAQTKPFIGNERVGLFAERKSAFQFFYLLSITVSSDRSLPAAISNIRTNYTARTDARTRSEPVPAWCRCNDGTHFFLCIGYFRFHNTSHRFDTKRARNARSMCHLDGRNGCEIRRIPVNFIQAIVANKIPK